ncbi:hypothetical protein [Bradyrhizobium sp. HKCCYLR20261]|uniref:hypothetical protein n=1 Tax=Bradyrhizobium sp. HKCCYLR20261 TaxID=3420760 RepID=UPI003EB910FA
MKLSDMNSLDDAHDDQGGLRGSGFHLQQRIAVLMDENEKLRRIASELASHNGRIRRSNLRPN